MARLAFRQGIVSHQSDTSNNPTFLSVNGNYVDLVVSPDPTIIAFIHRTADYLYTESVSESQAWGPLDGTSVWLYWDLDATTGLVTKGLTDLQPIESPNTPQNPAVGQMWFNSTTNQWHEYTGSRFAEVIRVFAAHLLNGSTLQSMANNPVDFTGTQVGINTSVTVGSLLFTSLGNPIIGDNNMFFTSEDRFFAGVPSGSALRISNIIMTGEAVNNMAAYSVVQYNDFNQIGTANPFVQGLRLYGIIETDAVIGDSVNFIPEGMIVNEDWDWIADGATVNDPVYVSATGTIVLTPAAPQQLPVGVVTGQQEIMFAPRLFPQVTVNASTGSTDSSAAQQNALDIANHVQSITNHDDIDTTQANVDDVLTWNGSIWEPSPPTATAMSSGGVTSQDLQNAIDGVEAAQAIVDQAQDDAATAEETDDDAVNAAQDALISANNTLAQANATLAAANATLAHDGGVQDAAIATLSDEQDDLAELVTDNASDIVDLQNGFAAMVSGSTPVINVDATAAPANVDLGTNADGVVTILNMFDLTNGGVITSADPINGETNLANYSQADQVLAIPNSLNAPDPVSATQPNNAPDTVIFEIVPGVVELQRSRNGGWFNRVVETSFADNPAGTEWRQTTTGTFTDFAAALNNQIGNEIVNAPALQMRVIESGDIYDIDVTSWQNGGGGGFAAIATLNGAVSGDGWTLSLIPEVSDLVADTAANTANTTANTTAINAIETQLEDLACFFIPLSFSGVLPDSTIVAQYVVATDSAFASPADQPIGTASVASNDATNGNAAVLNIMKNGSFVGFITFADGATTGTISVQTTATFAKNDVITIETATQFGLSDVAFTIIMKRTGPIDPNVPLGPYPVSNIYDAQVGLPDVDGYFVFDPDEEFSSIETFQMGPVYALEEGTPFLPNSVNGEALGGSLNQRRPNDPAVIGLHFWSEVPNEPTEFVLNPVPLLDENGDQYTNDQVFAQFPSNWVLTTNGLQKQV